MEVKKFYEVLEAIVLKTPENDQGLLLDVLDKFNNILVLDDAEDILKITNTTILMEAFYKSLSEDAELKSKLTLVRKHRWKNHYGVPTIEFLLTFHNQISEAISYFQATPKPEGFWQINSANNLIVDHENNVLFNPDIYSSVAMPDQEEKTGHFLKTYNPSGGFTTTPCDLFSQKFIQHSAITKKNGNFLEIGAAFGSASLQVLKNGATVFCNDIEPLNLAVIRNRYKKDELGDNLVLVPGAFPDELSDLPHNFFDAILICRVLHFFPGKKIEKSLAQIFNLLKPNGKLYVVCETPFLKNWQKFIPEHEERILSGMEWPGEISSPADFESSGRATSLPKFVHWISKEILERSLIRASFRIEESSYINRLGQFPDDLVLYGKESVGAIASKTDL